MELCFDDYVLVEWGRLGGVLFPTSREQSHERVGRRPLDASRGGNLISVHYRSEGRWRA